MTELKGGWVVSR